MNVNFIDFIVIFFIIYFLWQGYHTGFIGGLLNIVSTSLSFIAAILFYPNLGQFFMNQFGWTENLSLVAAFFIILIVVELVLSLIFHRVYLLIAPFYKSIRLLIIWDKVLGLIPSFLVGLFLVSLFLLLPLILPVSENIRGVVADSWWGKNVLTRALKYQPQLESVLNRLPYKNLAYLITPQPLSRESIELNFPKEIRLVPDKASEKAMFDLVNKERKSRGLKAVIWDDQVRKVARAHCLDMFERGYFSHYSPEGVPPFQQNNIPGRFEEAGIEYKAAGENLAYAPSVEVAHQGLMDSPGHRANILRPEFGHLGVGVIDGGINGKMFCQEFTD
ncbi:MAG TPA: CvpA family protein [Candidatus Nanoarchaeia archaeon]